MPRKTWWTDDHISSLVGKTIFSITVSKNSISFKTGDGEYIMLGISEYGVVIELQEVDGDLEDLLDSPVLEASEKSGDDQKSPPDDYTYDSWTWALYKIGTRKGRVNLWWLGIGIGYYPEMVSFLRVNYKK